MKFIQKTYKSTTYQNLDVWHNSCGHVEATVIHKAGYNLAKKTLKARFMGSTWGPSGAERTQVGLMVAPWILLPGKVPRCKVPTDDDNLVITQYSRRHRVTFLYKWYNTTLCIAKELGFGRKNYTHSCPWYVSNGYTLEVPGHLMHIENVLDIMDKECHKGTSVYSSSSYNNLYGICYRRRPCEVWDLITYG